MPSRRSDERSALSADTNVVLALVRGGRLGRAVEAHYGLTAMLDRPLVSVVTHGEIRVLAARNGWGPAKLTAMESALDHLVTVGIGSQDVIDSYVEIDLASQRHPSGAKNMGKNDLWIAACAQVAGARLLTTDKDFTHLGGTLLDVDVWDPETCRPR